MARRFYVLSPLIWRLSVGPSRFSLYVDQLSEEGEVGGGELKNKFLDLMLSE